MENDVFFFVLGEILVEVKWLDLENMYLRVRRMRIIKVKLNFGLFNLSIFNLIVWLFYFNGII